MANLKGSRKKKRSTESDEDFSPERSQIKKRKPNNTEESPSTSGIPRHKKNDSFKSRTKNCDPEIRKLFEPFGWRASEKKLLAKAIRIVFKGKYIVGDSGIDTDIAHDLKIAMKTCGRQLPEIRAKMKQLCRVIHKHRRLHDHPIDKWAEILDAVTPDNNDLEQQLFSAIMVTLEEEIPKIDNENENPPKELPVPDYDLAYKYLAAAVADKPLPKLTPITALLIEDCTQSLMEQIKFLDDSDLRKNLRSVYLCLTNDPDKKFVEDDDEEVLKQFAENSSLTNPLGINYNSIIPVPPKLL